MVEYLNAEIANEGISCNDWQPGAWANTPVVSEDDWQPDIEPPRINDYAAFKKHKHYGRYFRPYRYQPFPAWMYHATLEPKIVKSKEDVIALGPDWSPIPKKPRLDMTGKSLPVKTDTQRLTEALVAGFAEKQGSAAVDPTSIAAIVAAVIGAMNAQQQPAAAAPQPAALGASGVTDVEGLRLFVENPKGDEDRGIADDGVERKALLELAEKEGIKVDGRWSNDRIKKALGL